MKIGEPEEVKGYEEAKQPKVIPAKKQEEIKKSL